MNGVGLFLLVSTTLLIVCGVLDPSKLSELPTAAKVLATLVWIGIFVVGLISLWYKKPNVAKGEVEPTTPPVMTASASGVQPVVQQGGPGSTFVNNYGPTQAVPEPVKETIIEISYEAAMMGLPIVIKPGEEAYIITIDDKYKVDALRVHNTDDEQMKWPTSEPLYRPDHVGKIRYINHGYVSVFNMSCTVNVEMGGTNDPGGLRHLTFTLPPTDVPVGDKASIFYLVNKSSMMGHVLFPSFATAKVQGETHTRKLGFAKRTVALPFELNVIWPSWYKWIGNRIDPASNPTPPYVQQAKKSDHN